MTRTYWSRADWCAAFLAHPGLTAADFARVTGKSLRSVHAARKAYGLWFRYSPVGTAASLPEGHGVTRPSPSHRSERGWTNDELIYLRALCRRGLSATEIGKRLGRSRCSVLGKLHREARSLARLSPQTRAA